jgi:uncharacterized membrane protein YbaN (DUF454 family)
MNVIENILKSFNTEKGGFAARKLTAFALMVCVAYIHYYLVDSTIAVEVLIVDLSTVLLCLGLVTASNIIELKNGKNNETK